MTTTKQDDYLNRLTSVSSIGSASAAQPIAFNYTDNSANQRTIARQSDWTHWRYNDDDLGQVNPIKPSQSDNHRIWEDADNAKNDFMLQTIPKASGVSVKFGAVAILALLVSVAFVLVVKEFRQRSERQHFQGLIAMLAEISLWKEEAARNGGYTNGYPIKWNEIEELKARDAVMNEEGNGEFFISGGSDFKIRLNQIGVAPTARFLRPILGHPVGYEISGSCAEIMHFLYEIDLEKTKFHRWPDGGVLTPEDNYARPILVYTGDAVCYFANRVGVQPTAKVLKPWKGLPAGLEIDEGGPRSR